MVKFTLKQCRYFEAVSRYGGMAQAAREINITQPAIAQAMDKLEELCGYQLFLRHHAKGFELTSKGRSVRLEIQKLINQSEVTMGAIEAIGLDIQGTIRLGCFQSIAPFYIPKIIKEYGMKYPRVELQVFELLQDDIVHQVLANELDMAILYDLGLSQYAVSQFPITEVKPYAVLPKNHKLTKNRSVSLKDLADENYVLFDAPGSTEYFGKLFLDVGIRPKVSYRSTSMEAVRTAVGNGMGFSILSMKPPSSTSYDGNEIVCLDIEDNIDPTAIVLITNTVHEMEPMQINFINHCKNIIAD